MMKTMETNSNRKRRIIIRICIGIIFMLIAVYVYTNIRLPWSDPSLTINDSYRTISSDGTITVQGVAKRANSLTLNGSVVLLDRSGEFSDTITIPMGYSVLEIKASDRFGHTTTKILQVYR